MNRRLHLLNTFLAQRPEDFSNVFSFAFRDDVTEIGENLCPLGRTRRFGS